MYQVIKWELDNGTLPNYVIRNLGCKIDDVFIGIGIASSEIFVFQNEQELIKYLNDNHYGTNWGPRADGTTPIFNSIEYAAQVFNECIELNNAL
jgi:hypothetical protein